MAEIKYDFTNLRKKEQKIIKQIGDIVKTEMETRAPNETGLMKASIFAEVSGNEVNIGTHGINYASYVEYFDWTGLPSAEFVNVEKPSAEMPNDMWKALFVRGQTGQTIPFARSAAFYSSDKIFEAFKETFKGKGISINTGLAPKPEASAFDTIMSSKRVPSSVTEIKSKSDYWNYRKAKEKQGRNFNMNR